MKPFSRSERVGGLMQRVISDLLKKKIKDPRISDATITSVSLSPDLRHARVYFVIPDRAAGKEEAVAGFRSAAGFLKRNLGRELDLRYMPELSFEYDTSLDKGWKIDELLRSVRDVNGSG